MWPSATPATENEDECLLVPRLPRKVPRRHPRLIRSKHATQCHKCYASHAKRRFMWPSATPATQNEGECLRVPRLPRKVPRRHPRLIRSKRITQCHKCHACHAKRRWMFPSALPATQNGGECLRAPRLPRKVPRRHPRLIRSKRVTQCHKCHTCHAKTKVNVSKGHACHAKRRWKSPSAIRATPATQNEGECLQAPCLLRKTEVNVSECHACHAKCRGVIRN